jgi:hypothetical protein
MKISQYYKFLVFPIENISENADNSVEGENQNRRPLSTVNRTYRRILFTADQ